MSTLTAKIFLYDHLARKHTVFPARVMSERVIETNHESVAGEIERLKRTVYNAEYNAGTDAEPKWVSRLGVFKKDDAPHWKIATYLEFAADAAAPVIKRIEPPELVAEAVAAVMNRGYKKEDAEKFVDDHGAEATLKSIADEKAKAAVAPAVIVPPAPVSQTTATAPAPEPQGPPKPPKKQ